MTATSRLALVGWLVLALGGLLVVVPTHAMPSASAAPAPQTSASHPYSDPTWFPLRTPARIGCARSGCGTTSDHGFDAIDLLGSRGDPVYAAGAGIAHVGGDSGDCSGSGDAERGRWVWVDHGGGVVSRYHHLDEILVSEGQLVTPATLLGAMGSSGDVPPCTTSYLHFEVRHGGLDGERVDLGSLRGCGADGPVQLPQVFGFDSWNDPGLHPTKRKLSPELDSRCVTADWATTAPAPSPTITRSDGSVQVALDVPAQATAWAVHLEIWRPSLNAWRTLSRVSVPAQTRSTVFTEGVENGRRYRVQAAVHQGLGWSVWSGPREAVGAPSAPVVRYLEWKKTTSSTKSYLHYGWSGPDTLGSPVTGYTLARSCGATASSLGAWKTSSAKASDGYRNLKGLKKAKVCDVRIQARNAVGVGTWSEVRRISR